MWCAEEGRRPRGREKVSIEPVAKTLWYLYGYLLTFTFTLYHNLTALTYSHILILANPIYRCI